MATLQGGLLLNGCGERFLQIGSRCTFRVLGVFFPDFVLFSCCCEWFSVCTTSSWGLFGWLCFWFRLSVGLLVGCASCDKLPWAAACLPLGSLVSEKYSVASGYFT